jgi:hypothetical protein
VGRFELLSGAKTPRQVSRLIQLPGAVASIELSEPVGKTSEIRELPGQSGNGVGMADRVIAGLRPRNRRHFERVPGIRLA